MVNVESTKPSEVSALGWYSYTVKGEVLQVLLRRYCCSVRRFNDTAALKFVIAYWYGGEGLPFIVLVDGDHLDLANLQVLEDRSVLTRKIPPLRMCY